MKNYRVARRYARALLEVAPRDQTEKWGAELERLAQMVEAPELMSKLVSPELPQESREQAQAVRYATRSLELANAQYTGGITTYLQVITAEEIALSNQVTEVQLKTRRMMASVSLIQALGGGWDHSQLPTPEQAGAKTTKTDYTLQQ